MGDDLVLALMEHLIHAVSQGDKKDDYEVREKRAGILSDLRTLGIGLVSAAAQLTAYSVPYGDQVYRAGREGYARAKSARDEAEPSQAPQFRGKTAVIERLKDELQSYIVTALDALDAAENNRFQSPMRLVVMIDDLDRLPPDRAVEVMEALKIFLDLGRCVYVLAIDFDVVKQGVRRKFEHEFDERKAIAFFDKIIQVPFHMPVAAYDIKDFLLETLKLQSAKDSGEYVNLAKESIGNNPRSLKRLANTFHLLKGLNREGAGDLSTATDRRQLFATLCAQTAFPLYYREFVSRVLPLLADSDDSHESLVEFFEDEIAFFDGSVLEPELEGRESITIQSDAEDKREKRLGGYGMTTIEAPGFAKFLDLFRQAFTNRDNLDATALEKALRRASVTSVGVGSNKVDETGSIRYGKEEALRVLAERKAGKRPLDALRILIKSMEDICDQGQFDVGVSSTGNRALFYVDSKRHQRGTFCEVSVGRTVLSIKFGRTYQPEDVVERWRQAAQDQGFDVSTREGASQYQVILRRVGELKGEYLNTLVGILKESHSLTREYFFGR